MILSQEKIDQINSEAEKYGFVVPYDGSNKFYNDDKVRGYQAGATEWADKAQGPLSTLALLRIWLYECKDHGKMLDIDHAIGAVETALAKYKEVANVPDQTDKLNKLLIEADQACANLKDISGKMKGRKICSQCGIDYDINQKHTCN
jgi:hypothetical protein